MTEYFPLQSLALAILFTPRDWSPYVNDGDFASPSMHVFNFGDNLSPANRNLHCGPKKIDEIFSNAKILLNSNLQSDGGHADGMKFKSNR
jgi:hypothetical protein